MKKIELICPNCNGEMDFNAEEHTAKCPYCGHKEIYEKEMTIEEAAERARRIAYASEQGRKEFAKQHEKNEKIKKFTGFMIFCCVILFVIIINTIAYLRLPSMNDPFEHITVTYTGTDGSGKATITKDSKAKGVEYSISPNDKLKENDEITIKAKSSEYRLGKRSKTYKVEGLLPFVTKPEDITTEVKDYLTPKTYDLLKNRIESSVSFKGTINKLERNSIYLVTDEKYTNAIYDVFKVSVKTSNGKVFDHYAVVKYDNVVLTKETSDPIKFSDLDDVGDSILAGNPKEYNAIYSNDYAGFMIGFETINNFESYLNTKTPAEFKVYKNIK